MLFYYEKKKTKNYLSRNQKYFLYIIETFSNIVSYDLQFLSKLTKKKKKKHYILH